MNKEHKDNKVDVNSCYFLFRICYFNKKTNIYFMFVIFLLNTSHKLKAN